MSVEKISLNSFRTFLFFFFGGAGCLLPFISLHLKSSGLTWNEIQIISYGAPLFATLGPVIIGPLVDYLSERRKGEGMRKSPARSDRNTYIRTVLSTTVLLSVVFYCLLLSVAKVERPNPRQPESSFVCDEHGASIVQEKCNGLKCFEISSSQAGTATLENCRFNCDLPSHYGYIEKPYEEVDVEGKATAFVSTPVTTTIPSTSTRTQTSTNSKFDISNLDDFFGAEPSDDYDDGDSGSGETSEFNWDRNTRLRREVRGDVGISMEEPPHICHDKLIGKKHSRTCFVFTPNSAAINVTVISRPFHEDDHYCTYPLGGNFSCRIPGGLEKPMESCKVICHLDKLYSVENVVLDSECSQVQGQINLSFWSYLLFRCMGDFFFSASISLLIGATIMAAGDEAGKEFILPSLSYGLFASVVGYLHSEDLSPLHLENIPNFFFGVVGFGFFTIFALLVLIFATNLCIGPPDWWKTTRNLQIRHKAEFHAILLVLIFLGMMWGPIYFHVPWHVEATGASVMYVGCAAAVGAFCSAPLAWKAHRIVDYCGYSNILIGAFTIYILRYTGLLFIENPWVLTIIDAMEAITLCLMLFSAIFYIRHLVPKHLTFTSQALAVAAHFCLGNGLGCLISSLLSPDESDSTMVSRNSSGSHPTDFAMNSGREDFESVFKSPHRLTYSVGAVSAAASAVAYFLLYHCCLKKKCFAPLYRSDRGGSLPPESEEKGMYTPLQVIRNGGQAKDEAES